MPLYQYALGTEAGGVGGCTNLENMTPAITPPRNFYKAQAQIVRTAGGARSLGLPSDEWRWGFLSQAEREQLRTICTGASAVVYMRTQTDENDDEWRYFKAIMYWPEDEEVDATRRIEFVTRFEGMEIQAEPE